MQSAQVFGVSVHGAQVLRELCVALGNLGNFTAYTGIWGNYAKHLGILSTIKSAQAFGRIV